MLGAALRGGHRASSGAFSLVEHSSLQPLPLLPPGSPQLPRCWRPSLAAGQVHLSLQGQPRESGASDPAGASLCPTCAKIGHWPAAAYTLHQPARQTWGARVLPADGLSGPESRSSPSPESPRLQPPPRRYFCNRSRGQQQGWGAVSLLHSQCHVQNAPKGVYSLPSSIPHST